MEVSINWISASKMSDLTGLSRSVILKLVDSGDLDYRKRNKQKNSSLVVSVKSYNGFWENKKK